MLRFLIFILPVFVFAQTKYSSLDVMAIQKHPLQTILIDAPKDLAFNQQALVDYAITELNIPQSESYSNPCGDLCWKSVHIVKPVGKIKEKRLEFMFEYFPKFNNEDLGVRAIKKLTVTGDTDSLIKLFTSYWSTQLDLNNVKSNEVATVRFLSDIATFKLDKGIASVEVVNVSNY